MMRPAGTTGAFTMAAKVPANSTSAVLYDELPPGGNSELAVRSVYIGESGSVAGESVDSNAVPVQVHHGFSGRRYQPAAVGTSFWKNLLYTTSSRQLRESVCCVSAVGMVRSARAS
jgi:hypothetical protein